MNEHKINHSFSLTDCMTFEASGIDEVVSFSEDEIVLLCGEKELYIEGVLLKVESFDTEKKTLSAKGEFTAFTYSPKNITKENGLFSRLFK